MIESSVLELGEKAVTVPDEDSTPSTISKAIGQFELVLLKQSNAVKSKIWVFAGYPSPKLSIS